jgi:hypothetical protein
MSYVHRADDSDGNIDKVERAIRAGFFTQAVAGIRKAHPQLSYSAAIDIALRDPAVRRAYQADLSKARG